MDSNPHLLLQAFLLVRFLSRQLHDALFDLLQAVAERLEALLLLGAGRLSLLGLQLL